MSEALTTYQPQSIEQVWHDPQEIQRLFAPKLSPQEFSFFMGISKATGANPFLREIWAVKYGDSPASVFHGRDFYRRKAQELESYDGHFVGAVYEKDTFVVKDGIPEHTYSLVNRGKLIAGYCVVYVKGRSVPYMVIVNMSEYSTGKSLWNSKPATMIQKVAEAQALRGAFQGTFGGTYDESEAWDDGAIDVKPQQTPPNPAALQKAYTAILELTKEDHPSALKNSIKKHLSLDRLEDCKDLHKLREYYAYKRDQKAANTFEEEYPQEAIDEIGALVNTFTPESSEAFYGAVDRRDTVSIVKFYNAAHAKKEVV